jgi:hypothetical protein
LVILKVWCLLRPAPHSSTAATKLPAVAQVVADDDGVLVNKAGAVASTRVVNGRTGPGPLEWGVPEVQAGDGMTLLFNSYLDEVKREREREYREGLVARSDIVEIVQCPNCDAQGAVKTKGLLFNNHLLPMKLVFWFAVSASRGK